MADDQQHDEREEREEQIRCRAGQSDQVFVADDFAEVAGDDGRGLGPADEHAAEDAEPDERARR